MAPYTKADKNIRMKKILHILIVMLALFNSTVQAGTVTRTIWEEDFEPGENKTDILGCNFSDIYVNDSDYPEENSAEYDLILDRDGANGSTMLLISAPQESSAHLNFNYDNSELEDNWTLSFEFTVDNTGALSFPQQLCITTTNAILPATTPLTSGTYVTLNKTYEANDNSGQYATYDILIGGVSTGKTLTINFGILYKFKLQCANANTNNATLTFSCIGGGKTITANRDCDLSTLGNLKGIYTFLESAALAGWNINHYDNFKLTKDKEVDDTPCAEPEYEITGAYEEKRIFKLTCSTKDADIYWSETQLEPGADGWNKYTSEVQTTSQTIYAYAYNSANETTSNIINFTTGADEGKLRLFAKEIVLTDYNEEKGYAFTVIPETAYTSIMPADYSFYYTFDDGNTWQKATVDETVYAAPGTEIKAYLYADGYVKSASITTITAVRPQAPEIWKQDFTTLVNSSIYGTDKKNIVLNNNVTFNADSKTLYGIQQFTDGSQNVNIQVDKRIGLSSSDNFFLQSDLGIVSTQPEIQTEDGEEYDYVANAEGLGINGLGDGQYIFITTTGGATMPITGCNIVAGTSTINEQIYRAYTTSAFINIPEGVSVKTVTICSNFEPVTTNEYGYAIHVSTNSLNFDDCTAEKIYVYNKEIRSGVFEEAAIQEVPAGEVFILKGTANTTYNLALGTATIMQEKNLLTVSEQDFNTSNYEKPIYLFDSATGQMVMAEKNTVISAGTPYILSELDAAEYFDITLDNTGKMALVYGRPLDFTSTEDLQAFIVTSESLYDNFEYTPVSNIPAETGVILVGEPNKEYHIQIGTATGKLTNNKLKGSSTDAYNTANTDSLIYMLSNTTDNDIRLSVIDKDAITTIPAGTAYLKSKYKGFVQIHTNSVGTASLIASQPISFTEVALTPYIVTGETTEKVITRNPTEIPAGQAFYIKGGTPDSIYKIPVVTIVETLADNKLISSQTNFNVSDTPNYVYALNATTGNFERMPEGYVVPAGEAYFISQYERIIDLGYVQIKTNENGVATYITQNALDFSSIELRAYIGISESTYGTIEKMEIEQAPAGTPIFVRGTANTIYEVPIIAGTTINVTANKLQGSLTEDFNVINQDYFVYVVKQNSSDFVKAEPSYVVPAGEAYYISSKIGVERITTGVAGATTWVTSHPLDFTSFEDLSVIIVTGETPTEVLTHRVRQVTKDCPIILRGMPNTTYVVPVGTCDNLGYNNKLVGFHDKPFAVNSVWGKVYVISAKTGKFAPASKTLTIPAGKAFLISEYNGTEDITTNEYGYTSWVSDNPLDFETIQDVTVYVVTAESFDSVYTDNTVKRLPAGSAFIIKGEPNTTYSVPVRECLSTVDNILKGSTTETFKVADCETNVYVINKQGDFKLAAKTLEIPARKAYFISKYRGAEEVTINSSGKTSHVTQHPLDFYEVKGLRACIVVDETKDSIYTKQVNEVPVGEPIILYGEPGKTYRIPIGTCEELADGLINRLSGSLTEDFEVSSVEPNLVYVLSTVTGSFNVAASSLVIPAGKAYLISKFTNASASAKGISSFIGEEDEDETTAIKQIDSTNNDGSHRFFNLAGQPVDEDYKGIAIDEKGTKYYRK